MIQSNAKSLLDNTAMLYKQTASLRHDVCLDQRSIKCKISENCSNDLPSFPLSNIHNRHVKYVTV